MEDPKKSLEEQFDETVEKIKKDPTIVTKYVIKSAVGYCASAVATIAIHTLVPKDALSRKQKIQLSVAAWAMGGAIANGAGEWAAEESMTSTILCAITNSFKKTDEPKAEPSPEEDAKEEATPE